MLPWLIGIVVVLLFVAFFRQADSEGARRSIWRLVRVKDSVND